MRSIKTRLVSNFMLIIIITVVILELMLINLVKQNYYSNLEDSMVSQIKISADLYYRYFSHSTLQENVLNNVDTFWKQTSAQVEIFDSSGKLLVDSIGIMSLDSSDMEDVELALKGSKGKWIGKVDYSDEKVMAIAYPLRDVSEIVGVLRFITSLREVNQDIKKITYGFIAVGLVVIFISGLLSIIFSDTIVVPLREVTKAARLMASGNFKVQSTKRYDDEIGKLSDTLNYMASEILKKDQLKNEFISSVSHELRTPLTSIKGWAITLKEGSMDDKILLKDGLEIIEKESDRLTSMVEELLDFSKFVSGKITLQKGTVNMVDVMEHVKKQMLPRAKRDNIEFTVRYITEIPLFCSDENRLKQVFINLLDNAFKFTPAGGSVTFSAESKGHNIIVTVADTGSGISKEELPKVKEKFYKGKSSKSKNGIGLSICDEIVKLMGGALEIKSVINKGTDVTVVLPLQEDNHNE